MDQRTIQILFALLRSAIGGTRLTEQERNDISSDRLDEVVSLSSQHDIKHLVVLGLKQNGLISQEKAELEKEIFKAAYRYEQIRYEMEKLCGALEKASISFLPLKGSVIRQYYPEPWMRTSCDIDVLVHREDVDRAKAVLVEKCGYTDHGTGSHDVSLLSPANVHVELHFDLVEDGIANESSKVLADVWNTVSVRDGYEFWYEMSDEYFYFYHIAHMAKHFEHGGCGIRSLIDLWILDRMEQADWQKRNSLLEKGRLLKFADAARKLSRIWFGGEKYDPISQQMEAYILRGGIYGTEENRVTIRQQQTGGRFRYAISKIFLPYDILKFQYPILQKHRVLTPVMEVRRWFKLLFGGHANRTMQELKYNQAVPKDKALAMQSFLNDIGL